MSQKPLSDEERPLKWRIIDIMRAHVQFSAERYSANWGKAAEEILDLVGREARAEMRERCAEVADQCAKGVAVEFMGESKILGIMWSRPGPAQQGTAEAIAFAIRSLPLTPSENTSAHCALKSAGSAEGVTEPGERE